MGKYREVTNELLKLVELKKSGKEISKILNLDYSTVHYKLRKLGINLPNFHNQLKFDNTVFDEINTEEKAYWLGFLYADGFVSSTNNTVELSLKGDDIHHLEKFKKFLNLGREVSLSTINYKGKEFMRCRICTCDKHFHSRLIELGCIPRKSLTLKFPSLDIFNKQSLIYDFIRGYVDGDGCLMSTSSGRLKIQIVGTKEFLEGIRAAFPNIFSEKRKDKRSIGNTYSIDCSHSKADLFSHTLYKSATIYLNRKYERYKKFAVPLSN